MFRLNVASGLFYFSSDPGSTATLIELTEDADEHVRDWATFGLGHGDVDNVEVRDALLSRLSIRMQIRVQSPSRV